MEEIIPQLTDVGHGSQGHTYKAFQSFWLLFLYF